MRQSDAGGVKSEAAPADGLDVVLRRRGTQGGVWGLSQETESDHAVHLEGLREEKWVSGRSRRRCHVGFVRWGPC